VLFQDGQRIVFIGDSVTDCGRAGAHAPFGNGYVSLVRAFVTARWPATRLTWLNRGVGGDTVRHLSARWDTDAVVTQPDWLFVMIGINDVWCAFGDHPEAAVPIDEYERTLRELLRRAVAATGCRLIVADPYLIEPDRGDPRRAAFDRYSGVSAALATDLDAVHIATQQAFDRVLEVSAPAEWSLDGIHPNLPGHAVIADAVLAAIGAR
jgi:lysophospholipase L1-like esterase